MGGHSISDAPTSTVSPQRMRTLFFFSFFTDTGDLLPATHATLHIYDDERTAIWLRHAGSGLPHLGKVAG